MSDPKADDTGGGWFDDFKVGVAGLEDLAVTVEDPLHVFGKSHFAADAAAQADADEAQDRGASADAAAEIKDREARAFEQLEDNPNAHVLERAGSQTAEQLPERTAKAATKVARAAGNAVGAAASGASSGLGALAKALAWVLIPLAVIALVVGAIYLGLGNLIPKGKGKAKAAA